MGSGAEYSGFGFGVSTHRAETGGDGRPMNLPMPSQQIHKFFGNQGECWYEFIVSVQNNGFHLLHMYAVFLFSRAFGMRREQSKRARRIPDRLRRADNGSEDDRAGGDPDDCDQSPGDFQIRTVRLRRLDLRPGASPRQTARSHAEGVQQQRRHSKNTAAEFLYHIGYPYHRQRISQSADPSPKPAS